MNEGEFVKLGPVAPHRWDECFPVLTDPETGEAQLDSEENRTLRRIFRKLSQNERIKYHQVSCQGAMSPAHIIVINKIRKELFKAGIGDPEIMQHDLAPVIAVWPVEMAKNWPRPDLLNPVSIDHQLTVCDRCGVDSWIGPNQFKMYQESGAERVCAYCIDKDPELDDITYRLNPTIDDRPRRY